MRFNYGGMVTGATGRFNSNFGGFVAQKNGVVRAYVTPSNPQSADQMDVRNQMTQFSQGWAGLTDSQRLAWDSGAASGDWPITDPFTGTSRNPKSGFELYCQLNLNIWLVNGSAIDALPVKEASGDTVLGAITGAAGAGTLTFAYTGTLGTNENHVVYSTPVVAPGRMKFRRSIARVIGAFSSSSPTSVYSSFNAKFGPLTGQAGNKVFMVVVAINSVTGQRRIVGSGYDVIAA